MNFDSSKEKKKQQKSYNIYYKEKKKNPSNQCLYASTLKWSLEA